MLLAYVAAAVLGGLLGAFVFGGPGAPLGACVAVMLASVFILNRE